MIKINKSLLADSVPKSIRPAFKQFFLPKNIYLPSKTTNQRRHELIRTGAYIDNDLYNSRYKFADVKQALQCIYNNKCAFCEQKVEQFHVEHYRPKQLYFWLAYSWDNLLCACSHCNGHKGTNFQINGTTAQLDINVRTLKSINALGSQYDAQELPDMVNPEVTDPEGNLDFQKDGNITSNNPRFTYTIGKCRIDRLYLKDGRKKIFDDFREDINSILVDNSTKEEQKIALKNLVLKFTRDANNVKNDYLSFRRYVIANWLRDELKAASRYN